MADGAIKKTLYLRQGCEFYKCDLDEGKADDSYECNQYECDDDNESCDFTATSMVSVKKENLGYKIFDLATNKTLGIYESGLSQYEPGLAFNDELTEKVPIATPFKDINYYLNNINSCNEKNGKFHVVKKIDISPKKSGTDLPSAVLSIENKSIPILTISNKKTPDIINNISSWLETELCADITSAKAVVIFYPKIEDGGKLTKAGKQAEENAIKLAQEFIKNGIYAVPFSVPANIYKPGESKPNANLTEQRKSSFTVAYLPNSLFGNNELLPLKGIVDAEQQQEQIDTVKEKITGLMKEELNSLYVDCLKVAGLALTGKTEINIDETDN